MYVLSFSTSIWTTLQQWRRRTFPADPTPTEDTHVWEHHWDMCKQRTHALESLVQLAFPFSARPADRSTDDGCTCRRSPCNPPNPENSEVYDTSRYRYTPIWQQVPTSSQFVWKCLGKTKYIKNKNKIKKKENILQSRRRNSEVEKKWKMTFGNWLKFSAKPTTFCEQVGNKWPMLVTIQNQVENIRGIHWNFENESVEFGAVQVCKYCRSWTTSTKWVLTCKHCRRHTWERASRSSHVIEGAKLDLEPSWQ